MVTAREYISYIAESAGCFACIGRDGKLYFREIYQDETEITLELFADYKWGEEFKITKVSYEDGIRSFKFGDETRNNLWINQDNMYIVDEEQVQNIYNNINGLVANSFEGRTIIDPSIDIGDKIVIDGKTVIYQGEMTLEGRFIAEISSKIQIKQKEETTVKKESQKLVNRRVQSEINQIDGKITQLVEQTGEYDEKISKVEQDLNGITQQVSSIQDLTRTKTGIKKIVIEDAYPNSQILEIHIYGNNDVFSYLYPAENLYPSENLYPYGDSRIKFKNDLEEKVVDLGIEDVLRANKEVKDEVSIINGRVNLIRRVDENGETKIQEEISFLGTLDFMLSEERNEFEILNYNAEISIKYAIKSNFTDIFATKVEMNSSITQTAEEINLEVRKKVNENEVCSVISQSAEEILIKGNRFIVDSDNFKMKKDGTLTCRNAELTGVYRQYDRNKEILGLEIQEQEIHFFDWRGNGELVGNVYSVAKTAIDQGGIAMTACSGKFITLGEEYRQDGKRKINTVFQIDTNNMENTPWVKNTASGKLFPNAGEGITVENGFIKTWNLPGINGDLYVKDSNGIDAVVVHVKSGLIVGWEVL